MICSEINGRKAVRRRAPVAAIALPLPAILLTFSALTPLAHAEDAAGAATAASAAPPTTALSSDLGASTAITTQVGEVTIVAQKDAKGADRPVGPNSYVLTKSDWDDALAGTNVMALVKNMPGVTFTSTDAYGLDESDANLFMRGFHMNELAITFEGIPLNDTSYGSLTGTTVLNVGVPEDVGSVRVSPGIARESTFSSSDDGGELLYALTTPKATPSVSLTGGYGSNNTRIIGFSGQTGQVGSNGPRILVGIENISKDKYEGGGTQNVIRADIKAVQDVPWGDFTAFFSVSDAKIWGYNNLSFDLLHKLGWSTDYAYPNYKQAYTDALPQNANAACGPYTCGELVSLVPYDSGQTTTDLIGNLTHHFNLSPNLSGSVMVYGASNDTHAGLADPSTPSTTGAPFSELVWTPNVQRFGGSANLQYEIGRHTVSAGAWLERANSASQTSWYNEPLLGQGAPLKTIGPYTTYGPAFQTAYTSKWQTNARQFYLRDDYKVTEDLTLSAGFKAVNFSTVGGGVGPNSSGAPYGALSAKNDFLPHLSADWRPDPRTKLFVDMGETEIGYRVSPVGNNGYSASPWTAPDQAAYDAASSTLKPERDWNFTAGASRRFGAINVTSDAFYSLVLNRLLNPTSGAQFTPVRMVGVIPQSHIVGADLGFTAHFLQYFTFYQAASISRFQYDDNLVAQGAVYPLKGKYEPGYPGENLTTEVSFRYQAFEGALTNTLYLDQPFSYENDIYVPNYWMINGHASYQLRRSGALPDLTFRLDVNNLANRKNVGTVGIAGYSLAGDYQTFMRAAPRQLLFTVSAKY
jgi:iron complex outermembrane recepter protein